MRIHNKLLALVSALMFAPATLAAVDSNTGESTEIKFQASTYTDPAWPLKAKVVELESPVEIFEYVRNKYDFALYHGARSGSINTFMGMRGNDVDLAATLIAMLRAKGYPARYAVGVVRLSSTKVKNWLAVKDTDLAYALLRNQGIQSVTMAGDKATISFEHAWVEVLVPYGNYRGAGPSAINCATTPASCSWVSLDPSFKQRVYSSSLLDPYASGLRFDYTAYYEAVKNNTASLLNKNPLEIYQNQIQTWLQANAPGKTLADIPDFGGIIVEEDGLLPASLPFVTVGAVRRYNSIADHDEGEQSPGTYASGTEPKRWTKYVTVTPLFGTGTNLAAPPSGSIKIDLVTASTQRLTYSLFTNGATLVQAFRLNGVMQANGSVVVNGGVVNGQTIVAGSPAVLRVSMDGSPGLGSGSPDDPITADYRGTIGGYYLVATGGESSNWAQVHRASQTLLKANQDYKIVFISAEVGCRVATGSGCTPYVAPAGANSYAAGMPKLLNSPEAMDDLTGGLLEVASNQYYASLRESLHSLDRLNKIKTPITGFLGVVSSSDQVEYIDGTAFSVQPGGLLIDMKGIALGGSWRINALDEYSNSHFELAGHILSSLEHETWQKLTGYDSISTVRGFQLSLSKQSAALVSVKRNNIPENTIPDMYRALGYSAIAPAGFTRHTYNLWNNSYVAFTSGTPGAEFAGVRTAIQGFPLGSAMRGVKICGADGCGAQKILDSFKTNYDIFSAAKVRANSLYGTVREYYGDVLATHDVIGNDVTSSGNVFNIGSFGRKTGVNNTYTYNLQEIGSPHGDGTYSLSWNAILAEPGGGRWIGISGFSSAAPTGVTLSGTGASYFMTLFLRKTGSNAEFYLVPAAGTPNGFYNTLTATIQYSLGGLTGTTNAVPLDLVIVRSQKVYKGSIPLTASVTISNNGSFNCNGASYNNQTPANLLIYLKSCFDTNVVNNEFFKFFSTGANDVQLRAMPNGEKQYSTRVANIRDELYDQSVAESWYEYIIPNLLSTTPTMRFSVGLRRESETASGRYRSLSFEILNEWTSVASGGFVRDPSVAAEAIDSPLTPCANIQGAPLKCQL